MQKDCRCLDLLTSIRLVLQREHLPMEPERLPTIAFLMPLQVDRYRLKGWPTVVFEMAWTQTSEELAWACGRWVGGSEAKVNLAIGIDVILKSEKGTGESGKNKKGKNKQEGGENERESEAKVEVEKAENENVKGNLKRKDREEDKEIAQLWVTLWEVVKAEPLMETTEPINELIRADGKQDDPEILTNVPPPTRFTFISPFSDFPEQIAAIKQDRNMPSELPLFVKYHVAETQRLQVCPPIITIHSI
jgi:hypothetical protein